MAQQDRPERTRRAARKVWFRSAEVGISVSTAVDVAKDAADIVLLERSLNVLHESIIKGRRAFGNVLKYLLMGDEFQLRQYVQHGRRVTVPAVFADAADADSAE